MNRLHYTFGFLLVLLFRFHSVSAQNWQALGPDSFPSLIRPFDYTLKNARGIGRVCGIFFQPKQKCFLKNNPGKMYVGSPYGGLWESSNNGAQWIPSHTDQLPNTGIASLAFHPKKSGICYLATGDPDCILSMHDPAAGSESCQSRGIVKSTDGGKTWSEPIGIWYRCDGKPDSAFWKFPSLKVVRKILIHPKKPNVLFVVIHTCISKTKSFDGFIYRSVDAGKNWYPALCVTDGFLKDLEFVPGNPDALFASGRTIHMSTDCGLHWDTPPNRGLPPDSLVLRFELSFCPAKPENVYALCVLKNSYQNDFYLSENSGLTFKKRLSVPASPEWRTALAVHPGNPDLVFFSAGNRVNKLVSYKGLWNYKNAGDGLHDDVHELTFDPTGKTLYASTDGGLYASSDEGENWRQISRGLNIAECWSVSVSQQKPYRILAGMQDCGTQQFRPSDDSISGWYMVRGGDGMEALIDPDFPRCQYSNDGNNNLTSRSEDGGITWSRNLAASRKEKAQYLRPFIRDPQQKNVLYTGYSSLFKSKDKGESWTALSSFPGIDGNATLIAIAVAPSDSLRIYAAFANPAWSPDPEHRLYKSSDGGKTWTDITIGLKGVSYSAITCLAIQPDNPEIVLVGFKGGWDYKVMRSESGGEGKNPWKNYSSALPSDADVNVLLFDNKPSHVVYAGTHIGVFVTMDNLNAWRSFNYGLPRVMVSDMDILHATQELYIGTHGRGIWKSPLFISK